MPAKSNGSPTFRAELHCANEFGNVGVIRREGLCDSDRASP
jgi:hypothetical protein